MTVEDVLTWGRVFIPPQKEDEQHQRRMSDAEAKLPEEEEQSGRTTDHMRSG